MTAVIYTHVPDFVMAGHAARVMFDQGIRVFLALDRASPSFHCEFGETIRTGFERRGNLNGRSFITGHLQLLMDLAADDDDDYVFKVDSDTLGVDLRKLVDGRVAPAVGVAARGTRLLQGCAYALKKRVLPEMLLEAGKLPETAGLCEDQTIGKLAGKLGPVELSNWDDVDPDFAIWNGERGAEWHRARGHAVVAFDPKRESRGDIARAMKSFLP